MKPGQLYQNAKPLANIIPSR